MNIRQATIDDAAAIAGIKIAGWRSAYKNIVPHEFLQQMDLAKETDNAIKLLNKDEKETFAFVADIEPGQTVGYVFGGSEREGNELYRGEIYAIYLLDDHHNMGIGRLLRTLRTVFTKPLGDRWLTLKYLN